MPTFEIGRTSNWKSSGHERDKIISPHPDSYVKSEILPRGGEWFYHAIDLEWSELGNFMRRNENPIVLEEGRHNDNFRIEIYDDYRE